MMTRETLSLRKNNLLDLAVNSHRSLKAVEEKRDIDLNAIPCFIIGQLVLGTKNKSFSIHF